MDQPILIVCPACGQSSRTRRPPRPGSRVRCPACKGVFRATVLANGAVELRDSPPPLPIGPPGPGGLPGRIIGEEAHPRTIFSGGRRNRPIGGYLPFEKARSYIGTFALWAILGIGSLSVYLYMNKVDEIGRATGRRGIAGANSDLDIKRKEFRERQKKAMERLKKQAGKAKTTPKAPPGTRTSTDQSARAGHENRATTVSERANTRERPNQSSEPLLRSDQRS